MPFLKKIEKALNTQDVQQKKFNDPVASKISWLPLKRGQGANIKTRKLVRTSSQRLEFKKTLTMSILAWFTIAIALFTWGIIFVEIELSISFIQEEPKIIPALIAPALFFLGGLYLIGKSNAIRAFDKRLGYYIYSKVHLISKNKRIGFDKIYAIQLLSEYMPGGHDTSSYLSYELNLILKDGTRVNVVDHGNRTSIVEDSKVLSRFLDVPLWNGIE